MLGTLPVALRRRRVDTESQCVAEHRCDPLKFGGIAAGQQAHFLAGFRLNLQFDDRLVVYFHVAWAGADDGEIVAIPFAAFGPKRTLLNHHEGVAHYGEYRVSAAHVVRCETNADADKPERDEKQ